MSERALAGAGASPGVAVGAARVLDAPVSVPTGEVAPDARAAEAARALEALDATDAELNAVAAKLRAQGRDEDAEIVETSVLMAQDPQLREVVSTAVTGDGRPAEAALLQAAEGIATLIASLDDPNLAARADDVRSIGRRAARLAAGQPAGAGSDASGGARVLVATDLGPADVAELEGDVCALALAAGAVTAHAAIVARSLGVPMVVGAGAAVLDTPPGAPIVVDGDAGRVYLEPATARVNSARDAMRARERARARS
jgi:phosphoenolpyruvate-protein kinase (PTS system EI component)